jgi:hypothetical protein
MSLRQGQECSHVIVNSSAGTTPVVAAVATLRVYIYKMILTIGTPAITMTIQDTAGVALTQAFQLAAGGSVTIDVPNNQEPWWNSNTGLGIQFVQSGTTPYGLDLWYVQGV